MDNCLGRPACVRIAGPGFPEKPAVFSADQIETGLEFQLVGIHKGKVDHPVVGGQHDFAVPAAGAHQHISPIGQPHMQRFY